MIMLSPSCENVRHVPYRGMRRKQCYLQSGYGHLDVASLPDLTLKGLSVPADVLTIDNLHVSYRGVKAVDGLTLSIPAGTMACIVGPNGSGKSTTLKAALGLVERSAGLGRYR